MNRKFYSIVKSVKTLGSTIKVNNSPLVYTNIPNFSIRLLSSTIESDISNNVTYTEVKKIGKEERKNDFIIDVRQPEELQETGVIPGSVNVPLDQLEAALKELSSEEFQKIYGVLKPQKDSLIVFSCRSGVRSGQAQALADQLGYKNSKNYTGGWLDWEEHMKK